MQSPRCGAKAQFTKRGWFQRPSDGRRIQRFRCLTCRASFSSQTFAVSYRHKKRSFNQMLFRHTYAMIRDNIKRLARRTWCATKKPACLELLLYIHAWFRNLRLDQKKGLVYLRNLPGPIV